MPYLFKINGGGLTRPTLEKSTISLLYVYLSNPSHSILSPLQVGKIILNDVELIQGAPLDPVPGRAPPTVGCLFTGALSLEKEWQGCDLAFSCDRAFKGHANPRYFSDFFRTSWKKVPAVDALIVHQPKRPRLRASWMKTFCVFKRTPCIVLIHHPDEWKSSSQIGLSTKSLKAYGYETRSWCVKAEQCGAATWASYLVTFAVLPSLSTQLAHMPRDLHLPLSARSCRNIIVQYPKPDVSEPWRFVGHSKNITRGTHPVYHNYLGTFRSQTCEARPVFSADGPFPADQTALIQVPGRGDKPDLRPMSAYEWQKLKVGYGDPPECVSDIIDQVETSVYGILGQQLGDLLSPRGNQNATPLPRQPPPARPTSSPAEPATEWRWESPDLSPGSIFRWKRMASLQAAIATLPCAERAAAYHEGLELLEIHSKNYTDEGPLQLVLLWWEWPPRHWDGLRLGSSMNFMEVPEPGFVPNQEMDEHELHIADGFFEELISLGILKDAEEHGISVTNNFPLFLVPKAGQPGKYRCIADGKRGGQNAACVNDPCHMTSPGHILPHLYTGGWSASIDFSKYFHMFKTLPSEYQFFGIVHPVTGRVYFYSRYPMGTRQSPAGSGRFGASFIRILLDTCPLFQGRPVDNTFQNFICHQVFDAKLGEGRVLIGSDGLPALLVWLHVDDLLLHGPTYSKVSSGLQFVLDEAQRLGLIYQPVKLLPPTQELKFCGFLYNTAAVPCLRIPEDKVSKALALIHFLERGIESKFARLTVSVVVGVLQSLVPATPENIGASFLQGLYADLFSLKDRDLMGTRRYYFTYVNLSGSAQADLAWWRDALQGGLSNQLQATHMGSLAVTWGDGSGNGCGGTFNWVDCDKDSKPVLETWMGVWQPTVHSFSSNWKESRTLKASLERLVLNGSNLGGTRLWYLTDNQVLYDTFRKAHSSSPSLMQLIRDIKLLELTLQCSLRVYHVPGKVMIDQGTDGLSRGVPMHQLSGPGGYSTLGQLFRPALPSLALLHFCFRFASVDFPLRDKNWIYRRDADNWSRGSLLDQYVLWTVSPQLAKQCMLEAVNAYVESPFACAHLFVVPRVNQRDFGRVHKDIGLVGVTWGAPVGFNSLVPFSLFYISPFDRVRTFKRYKDALLDSTPSARIPRRIQREVEALRGLS